MFALFDFTLRLLAGLAGLSLILATLHSAIRTFVLPRGAQDWLSRTVFVLVRWGLQLFLLGNPPYAQKDRVLAFYAPLALLTLPPVWLVLVGLGYTGLYWALGLPWATAERLSGSSLLTLGIEAPSAGWLEWLAFTEAALGLVLVALLIAYLPTMYSAFAKRETAVTLLAVRAGEPASAVEMLKRYHRLHGLAQLGEAFAQWEVWFAELEESHTSLPALNFFRSPQPIHSWVVAAGAVLDAAALRAAVIDLPPEPRANLCIRAGYLALRRICDFFDITYKHNPNPTDAIRISRAEFDAAYDDLQAQGLPLKADRDQAWQDFAGWRVNYDLPLIALCVVTTAPPAPWSSDRAPQGQLGKLFIKKRKRVN